MAFKCPSAGMLAHRLVLLCVWATTAAANPLAVLSAERIVFQTDLGALEMALYPKAAPKTVAHILEVARVGGYNTNHFFRVDKGFVAQTADITSGRSTPPDARQREVDEKKVPLEVHADLKHDKRGLLSMARHADPNSGGSSFSIMLNPAPHLDMQYTVFGEVVAGIETLAKMEGVETFKEGMFVMPTERLEIQSSYVTSPREPDLQADGCKRELQELKHRFVAQAKRLEKARASRLP